MQIRSCDIANRKFSPTSIPDDFPVECTEKYIIGSTAYYLHRHNAPEIGYCYDGSGVFIIGDGIYPFNPGDVSVINSGVFHIAKSSEGSESTWAFAWFDPKRLIAPFAPSSVLHEAGELFTTDCPPLLSADQYPDISSLTKQIAEEMLTRPDFFTVAVAGMIACLGAKIHRIESKPALPGYQGNNAMERIAPALQHIAHHYAERISMPMIADLCCVSEAQMRRLFHTAVCKSPQEYLTEFRLRMAVSLLANTTYPILEISEMVGYSSVSSFNRLFRAEMGISPREYRCKKPGCDR
ncbi:MAG TPA: AraC family transcriptional regulator [Armatimonadota bacterium]|jgi:transcriptional regulator GlxA family with amidase domain